MSSHRLRPVGIHTLKALPHRRHGNILEALMTGVVWLCLSVTSSYVPAEAAEHESRRQTIFYVAPSTSGGSDSNPGTIDEPFLTLERAKQGFKFGTKVMTAGDVIVYLRNGTYALEEPLLFHPDDSGQYGYNVSYTAYPGESPVITGGKRISGWIDAGNGIYKANSGGIRFRQLYVKGQPRNRARTPNEGKFRRLLRWDESKRTLVARESEPLQKLSSVNGVEIVVHKEWTQNNLRLASYELIGSDVHLVLLEPDRTKAFRSHEYLRKSGQSFYLENAYEFLDEEGEWYLNTTTDEVFYMPRLGEDISSLVALAPQLVQLIRLECTPTTAVKNIHFRGLVFEHSTWLEPSEEGFATQQADWTLKGSDQTSRIPGAIHIQNAENIRF